MVNFKNVILFFLVLFIPFFGISSVFSAEIVVNGDKFINIQNNIESANNGDIIKLSAKTYNANSSNSQISVKNKKNIIIQGNSSTNRATLNGKNLCRILSIDKDSIVTLKYINFVNGNVSGGSGVAIRAHGKVTVTNCSFKNNNGESGAAINLAATASYSNILDCDFTENKGIYPASDNFIEGGAVDSHASHTTVKNCLFIGNYALNSGGALCFNGGTSNQLINSKFYNNNAFTGGALRVIGSNIQISGCLFDKNNASYGGAIFLKNSKVVINSSVLTNNFALNNGGGISNSVTNISVFNYLNIFSSNLDNNKAKNGGGIYSNSNLNIFKTCFNKNMAVIKTNNYKNTFNSTINCFGGGIYSSGKTYIANNSKFLNNSAYNGGAIFSNAYLNIFLTHFDKNMASRSGGSIYSINVMEIFSSNFLNNKAKCNGGAICTVAIATIKNNSKFINNSADWGSGIFSNNSLKLFSPSFSKNKANSHMAVSLPNGVMYNDLTKVKVVFWGHDNIKDAIWQDKNGEVYLNNKKLAKNNLIFGKKVTINGKYSSKTNKNGEINLNYKNVPLSSQTKNYKFKVIFNGDNSYNSSENTIIVSAKSKIDKSSIWNIKSYKISKYQYKINKTGWYQSLSYNNKINDWNWVKLFFKPGISGNWSLMSLSSTKKWIITKAKPYTKANSNSQLIFLREVKSNNYSIVPQLRINYGITSIIKDKNSNVVGKIVKNQKVVKQADNNVYFLKDPNISSYYNKYLINYDKAPTNSPSIKSRVLNILNSHIGEITPRVKAELLFNWVRDNIRYPHPMYYNTAKKATGTLSSRVGNCVDQSHLLVSMFRMVKIPVRYQNYAYCLFNSGKSFPHCWAEAYVGGKWYEMDAVGSNNKFGIINNFKNRQGNKGPLITTSF